MQTLSRRMALRSLLATSLAAVLPSIAFGRNRGCAHCGRQGARCGRVCRLVREERTITTTCWGMECEDICVPGPSTPDCKHCETVCSKGPADNSICVKPKTLVWTSWIPGCDPEIVTKRKLMKKTVTKTVPSFKWVVEDLCPQCTAQCQPVSVPAGTKLPPVPEGEGLKIVSGKTV